MRIVSKFSIQPPGLVGMTYCSNGLITGPTWPPLPHMVKTFKNLLQNKLIEGHETWYIALGTKVL